MVFSTGMYARPRIPGSTRLLCFAVLIAAACGRPTDEHPRDTAAGMTSSANPSARAFPAGAYVSRGACPFECCVYGRWSLRTGALLRSAPGRLDSIRVLPSGTVVSADSGLVVVNPVGLLELSAAPPTPSLGDSLRAQPGDTVELLDYIGEGIRRVRLRGRELEVEEFWRFRDTPVGRVLREPVQHWWVFMTDSASHASGWVLMDSVQVSGADACG